MAAGPGDSTLVGSERAEPAKISGRVRVPLGIPDRYVLKALRDQLCSPADRLGSGLLA